MFVDTDVLIWHLRGCPAATRRLDQLTRLTLSALTCCERLQGLCSKAELAAVKTMLERRGAEILPLTEAITLDAIVLMESPDHRPASIAAAACTARLTVATCTPKNSAISRWR